MLRLLSRRQAHSNSLSFTFTFAPISTRSHSSHSISLQHQMPPCCHGRVICSCIRTPPNTVHVNLLVILSAKKQRQVTCHLAARSHHRVQHITWRLWRVRTNQLFAPKRHRSDQRTISERAPSSLPPKVPKRMSKCVTMVENIIGIIAGAMVWEVALT